MDKKNTIIGLTLVSLAFCLSFWQSKKEIDNQQVSVATPNESSLVPQLIEVPAEPTAQWVKPIEMGITHSSATTQAIFEQYTLENDKVRVTFTTQGASIASVELKAYPAAQGEEAPVAFNAEGARGIFDLATESNHQLQPLAVPYELVSKNDDQGRILFRHLSPDGIEILRGYEMAPHTDEANPYLIAHETKIINQQDQALALNRLYANLGTVPPVEGDQTGEFLNFAYYNGKEAEFVSIREFQDSSGFLGIGKHQALPFVAQNNLRIEWGAVKNQFFAGVITPEPAAQGYYVNAVTLPAIANQKTQQAIQGALAFDLPILQPQESYILQATCYVGPKEYSRLQALGNHQDLVMQFGLFGFISKLLLILMTAIYDLLPNYGVAIILVTVLVKTLLWPLTAASVRSSKRMAALQEPMKALKEKFKDNPQRLQQETIKLFKEYRVNPAAGCLPILIQIPIFLGLFWMLRSASELRFAHFLWIQDLSLPDTVYSFHGLPLNILPLFMGVTMVLQMRLSPTPTTDPIQQKMFQFMPFIFLIICYNFPSGLVLYWTVQNILTILQQAWMRREPAPALVIEPKVKKSKKFA